MNIQSNPTPVGFVESVADKLAEVAGAARETNRQHSGQLRAISALDVVARYVKGVAKIASTRDTSMKFHHPQDRPITAPAYQALYLASGQARRYQPGRWQLDLLRTLAVDFGGYADPSDVLAELACRAIRDREAHVKAVEDAVEAERAGLAERVENAEKLRGPLENATTRVRTLADEVATLRAQLQQATAQLADERGRTALLWGALDELSPADDEPADEPKAKPRRTKVEGEVGIYRARDTDVYEIGWTDAAGEQRWKRVGPDIEVARAARAERIAEVADAKAAVTT